jgi:hypothetical protein
MIPSSTQKDSHHMENGVERASDHVIRDLAAKLDSDVLGALSRTAMLVEHPVDRAVLSILAVGGAIGFGIRFFKEALPGGMTDEQFLDALWETRLRPSVLEGLKSVTSATILLAKARGDVA